MTNQPTASEIARAAIAAGITLTAALAAAVPAQADVINAYDPAVNSNGLTLLTVHVSELAGVPACAQEDCSDVPASQQPGIWTDSTGEAYLIWTDGPTYLVVDDTIALASTTRPLCPQGEDGNGRLPRLLNCQMWIQGGSGDDNGDGYVSEDESGWAAVR